jgi:SAM-dependent methyltransferase
VHQESIEWLQEAAGPELHAFACAPEPPLPIDAEHFDLVLGISAFTHIGWNWARWLAEMHRILRPGGLLAVSLLGPDVQQFYFKRVLFEDEFGLLVLAADAPAEGDGPVVFHSQWWLRAHWGRAFEILALHVDDFVVGRMNDGTPQLQSMLVARRRNVPVTIEGLTDPEPCESREARALMMALGQTVSELVTARAEAKAEAREREELGRRLQELQTTSHAQVASEAGQRLELERQLAELHTVSRVQAETAARERAEVQRRLDECLVTAGGQAEAAARERAALQRQLGDFDPSRFGARQLTLAAAKALARAARTRLRRRGA